MNLIFSPDNENLGEIFDKFKKKKIIVAKNHYMYKLTDSFGREERALLINKTSSIL